MSIWMKPRLHHPVYGLAMTPLLASKGWVHTMWPFPSLPRLIFSFVAPLCWLILANLR